MLNCGCHAVHVLDWQLSAAGLIIRLLASVMMTAASYADRGNASNVAVDISQRAQIPIPGGGGGNGGGVWEQAEGGMRQVTPP